MKSLVKEVLSFTNFVTFSNTRNDICFVNQTKTYFWWKKSLFSKTAIISSIAKSDEIGKKVHLLWLKEVLRDFVD